MTPAFELDTAIIELSGALASKGLPTTVNSAQDVDALMNAYTEVVKDLKLWQYYVLDVQRERESVHSALKSNKVASWEGPSVEGKSVVELADILRSSGKIIGLGQLGSRFGVSVDSGVAAGLVQAAFRDVTDLEGLSDAWIRVVDVLNVALYQEWEEDTKAAHDGVKNRLTYTRLDAHGPKLGEISKKYVSQIVQ